MNIVIINWIIILSYTTDTPGDFNLNLKSSIKKRQFSRIINTENALKTKICLSIN